MAAVPNVGFDVVAARIRGIQYEIHPLYKTASSALISSSRKVKGSFTKGGGKRKVTTSEEATPLRRSAVAITPAVTNSLAILNCTVNSSRSFPSGCVPSLSAQSRLERSPSGPMLIDDADSTVPRHTRRRASVLQHVYKRLRPKEIVCLSPGDEIIIVLPAPCQKTSNESPLIVEWRAAIDRYKRAFSRVIDSTIKLRYSGDRTAFISEVIEERHTFLREDIEFLEFECRAVNYPLREQLASESICLRSINYNWDQGAGINLSVCGYTERQKVLLKLHDVAFLEVYKLTPPDCFTTDSIVFANNLTDADRLVPPLVRQLSLFNGCPFSTD